MMKNMISRRVSVHFSYKYCYFVQYIHNQIDKHNRKDIHLIIREKSPL